MARHETDRIPRFVHGFSVDKRVSSAELDVILRHGSVRYGSTRSKVIIEQEPKATFFITGAQVIFERARTAVSNFLAADAPSDGARPHAFSGPNVIHRR